MSDEEPLRAFIQIPTDLEGQDWRIEGWASRERAQRECDQACDRFEEQEDGK